MRNESGSLGRAPRSGGGVVQGKNAGTPEVAESYKVAPNLTGKKHYARLQRRAETLAFRVQDRGAISDLTDEAAELKSLRWILTNWPGSAKPGRNLVYTLEDQAVT